MEISLSYDLAPLLKRIKKGDEFAFRILYDLYHKKVFSLGKKFLKSQASAEDLVQEIFTVIWMKRQKLEDVNNFNKYISTITINQIYNLLKRKAYAEAFKIEKQKTEISKENIGADIVENRELQQLLRQATQQLPPQQKKAFELSRYYGLKHEQIAEQMEISRETVKKHCMEATRNIKTWLKTKGIDSYYLILLLWF